MASRTKTLLLAHGSSDENWRRTFESLAAPTLASVPDSTITYMELCQPSLQQSIAEGTAKGYSQFIVVPLFLAAGRHLRVDVPKMIQSLETEYGVTITLTPPIGENPHLGVAIKAVVEDTLEA
ncbi:sirohydrochlorin chelatase [Marinobacter zhejiangensis]|uniref:Sirohydrochlorin cobaltochelatase n=1 Tax=Marinobacter zhejiangensis TaxID=488535 RepID=A0A1I4P9S3_9GAMM|nr:CbiX/SirB N-terminal domain-containing protein [Marinobacter zhejiangensis]SFM24459.1 sirohydrochlorin cobaltochelatase [Marinobacter zhejiangensis]